MATAPVSDAFVRTEDAPQLPPPPNMVGVQGWLIQNLFSSIWNALATVVFGAFLIWVLSDWISWGIINASWTGENRDACIRENAGACWPLVWAKMPQWIYGFFPIDQRWRVNICFIVGAAALIPMMIPSAPYKLWNALFLLIIYPLMVFILLTGGHMPFSPKGIVGILGFLLLTSLFIPVIAFGIEDGIRRNALGLGLGAVALALWLLSFAIETPAMAFGSSSVTLAGLLALILLVAAALASIRSGLVSDDRSGRATFYGWLGGCCAIAIALGIVAIDFGLVPVETPQWGGLIVTLVVSVTGIVTSLPMGILLALGRRSKMPVVRLFSVIFIELWRGVPLITVLFMSSVMLPLFLPQGMSFDKLLRALIGVALFSSAYMAEVVRGGLQAIPKGQYEAAQALGLSYWKTVGFIILPQALKVSIPNIVSNFISLFKNTTLVLIIGLFDLLGILQAGLRDANWATPNSAPTGYFTVAIMYWVFCFSMSRYSVFMERRLATGHKR
jgi:general L-amino acid transport system permease protein